jgi:DMSO/TMAO reductase YedYZ molybdopterin-dependent catalytic subunit
VAPSELLLEAGLPGEYARHAQASATARTMADMAGRRTNLALLALLAAALGTGALAFAMGTGWARAAAVAHGASGIGLLLLVPWKSVIARRGLRRRAGKAGAIAGTAASIAFAAAVAMSLLAGIGHSTGAIRSVAGITSMQVHVGAALVAVPLGLWHVWARRIRPRRIDLTRRALIRSGALAAGSLGAYGALSGMTWLAKLPGRERRFTGSYERGSFIPEEMPVTQWLDDRVPIIDGSKWSLSVRSGGEEVGRRLSLGQIEAMGRALTATIDCTGGWFARQRWEGVSLDRLIPSPAQARSVVVRSTTGYQRRFPIRDVGRLWVATRVGGEPLSPGHGFPARLVAPGRRGFWWVKWIEGIELSHVPWWWQPPFPLT